MREPLKILFAEPPPARRVGGIETALSGLARALPATRVQVKRAHEFDRAAIAEADTVHFHGMWERTHLAGRRWCRELGKPFVVSPHGMLEDWAFRHRGWKKLPYFHLLEKRSIARAGAVLATSEDEARTLRRWFERQTRVLPLGTDIVSLPDRGNARARLNFSNDEFILLFLSRCHEKKGLHLLIEAAPIAARATGKTLHLVVVGDGEAAYVDPLRRATAAWSGPLRATWAGAKWGSEKWDYFVAADLFCLPSFSENFGLAVLESLVAGTPVLTTPATPWDSLRGPLPVYLTAPAAPELAQALQARLDAPLPGALERSATQTTAARMFNWTELAPRYAELYRQVIADRT